MKKIFIILGVLMTRKEEKERRKRKKKKKEEKERKKVVKSNLADKYNYYTYQQGLKHATGIRFRETRFSFLNQFEYPHFFL